LTPFSPKSFFTNFSASALRSARQYVSKDELTLSSMLDLVGRECEGGEQLHHYLHDYPSHSGCRRDLGVDIETIQKAFYRLEQFNGRF
jgi:hypothetical protein